MQKLRLSYSVVSLLAFLAFAAFICAAALNANSLWAGITFNIAIGAMFWAAAGAICRRGEPRGFWLCFLVFSGGYLVLAFGPWFSTNVRPHLITAELTSKLYEAVRRFELDEARGATVYLTASGRVFVNNEEVAPEEIPQMLSGTSSNDLFVYEELPAQESFDSDYRQARNDFWNGLRGRYTSANTRGGAPASVPIPTHFDRVCHSLWALVFALVGGMVATWFQRRDSTAENRLI
jgi:hypothetical protein